ncbi:SDR family NAD(P)-dependent oxidoreductase [Nocardia sp. NPDC004654]|uniref:SDR family oxidoreductase n=1 Tax=Nocardia sp. NPDC004654 TaxID=3154776 RepID=UPI0033AB7FC0
MTRTILITGGASGIGRGLAHAFHSRGHEVIIASRNETALQETVNEHPGMHYHMVDVADAASVNACALEIAEQFPRLDTVINNAGLQKLIDFAGPDPVDVSAIDAEVDINLKGLLYMSAAFVPILARQDHATLIQVSSASAFIPLAHAPVYSATKAAVRSFTHALRFQLRHSGIDVIELIPPAVESQLHDDIGFTPPGVMALDEFITEALNGIDANETEIAVGAANQAIDASRQVPLPALIEGVSNLYATAMHSSAVSRRSRGHSYPSVSVEPQR